MSELNYGGIVYPNNPFTFDKIYPNFKSANENAKNDNILIGRYILIAYCDEVLDYDTRLGI